MSLRPGQTINVRDFGAKGDGVSDDTAALNAAAAAVPASGGILNVPPGRYAVAGTRGSVAYGTTFVGVRLHSNTTMRCDNAVIAGIGPNTDALNLLVNAGFQTGTELSDTNIKVEGCGFTLPGSSGSSIVFWFASHVSADGNTIHGGGDGIAAVGVFDGEISRNRVYANGNSAFDNFWGSSRMRIVGNYAEPLGAPEGRNGNSWGIQFTNTNIANEDVVMDDILISGNTIYYPGATVNTGAPIGIDGTLTGRIDHLTITHNHLFNTAENSGNPNIFLISAGSGWNVSDNILDGSKFYPAIIGLSGLQSGAIVANNVLSNCGYALPRYTGNIMLQGTRNTVVNNRQLASCTGTLVSLSGTGNVVLGNDDGTGAEPSALGPLSSLALSAPAAILGPVASAGSGLGQVTLGARGMYSVAPSSVSVGAPPSGGVQASVSISGYGLAATGAIVAPGTGCRAGDLLVPAGGAYAAPGVVRVTKVGASGAVAGAEAYTAGTYTRLPPTPSQFVAGTSHCAVTPVIALGFGALSVKVTNPGAGYTEPPAIAVGNGTVADASITATLAIGAVFISGLPLCAAASRGQLCALSVAPGSAVQVK